MDESVMVAIQLYTHYLRTATRQQFQSDAACTGEEIEGRGTFKVEISRQYIKDVFLGKVRCRPSLERPRYVEVPSLVFPCDDSHRPFVNKVMRSKGIFLIWVAGALLNSAVGFSV